MRKRLAMLLMMMLATGAAWAQNALWLDLSGDWRTAQGDDPRYAAVEFDDSGWQVVRAPNPLGSERLPDTFVWLRRTVQLPPGTPRENLALTIGKTAEYFQIFVNGALVETVGSFERSGLKIARPHTVDLPAPRGERVIIAIRVWFHPYFGATAAWTRPDDTGPWVLSSRESAPRLAGEAFMNRLRTLRTPDLAYGAAALMLALLVLLLFLGERSQPELLWLALHAGVMAIRRLQVVLLISPDSTPWQDGVRLMCLQHSLLIEFMLATFRLPPFWVRAVIWPAAVMDIFDVLLDRPLPQRLTYSIAAAVLVWSLFTRRERAPGYALAAGGLAVILFLGIPGETGWWRGLLGDNRIGPYEMNYFVIASLLFTLVMVLVLTRRLLADRVEKLRLNGELEAARTVQNLLLSRAPARSAEYSIEAAYLPAQQVGGDFYWSAEVAGGALLCAVGDVSGKGLKAALRVSQILGHLGREALTSPGEVLAGLNANLAATADGGFVTCCCLRLDPGGGVVLANAGHLPPLLDGAEVAVEPGLPLGLMADGGWPESRAKLAPGSRLLLMSDGVVEAEDPAGRMLGFERSREMSGKSPADLAEAARAWGQNDDITVVTVRRSA